MPDFTVTLTDAQVKVVRQLDATKTVKQVLQIHVETWLAPLVAQLTADDRKLIAQTYEKAAPDVQLRVKADLGLV